MSGDNLAIALFLWSLCGVFFFEGRKDEGWRHWLLWSLSALCFVGGFAWPYMGTLWPAGFVFVRTLAMSPVSWFVVFMSAIMLVAVSGRLKAMQQKQPDFALQITALKNEIATMEARIEPPKSERPKGFFHADVDWTPWKLKSRYIIAEFSRILVGLDPNGAASNNSEAYKELLIEQANTGKLKTHRILESYSRTYRPAAWNTEIDKTVAIAWAKANNIDVSHIE